MTWKKYKIGQLCELMTGGTPRKGNKEYFHNGEIKWLVSGDIHQKEIFNCKGRITQIGLENSNAKYLPINSVIIALNGQGKTRGSVAILRTKATCNQSLVSIFPKNKDVLLPEYLYFNLHSRYQEIRSLTGDGGNDRRGLNMPIIKNIEISLPDIKEQKRIVKYLNKFLPDIGRAGKNTEKNLENARQLFNCFLNKKFIEYNKTWRPSRFGDVCTFVRGPFGGSLKKNIFKPTGFAVYEQQHAIYNQFNNIRYFIDEQKFSEMQRFEVFPGDLIMSCSGTMGKIAIVPEKVHRGIINQALLKLSPNDGLSPEFLKYWMESNDFQYKIEYLAQGAAQKNMASVKILKEINIPMPSLNEQKRLVSSLKEFYELTCDLQKLYEDKLALISELKNSILQKAFNGELTSVITAEVCS